MTAQYLSALLVMALIGNSRQHNIDMGSCSCSCSTKGQNPLLVQRAGQPVGTSGPPGKRGPVGPPGPKGAAGPKGDPGQGSDGDLGSVVSPATSCDQLYRQGTRRNGVYYIRPGAETFQAYCDFQNGAGWTLVASVHENNARGKCSPGDKWSSEQGNDTSTGVRSAWMTMETFGNIESVTAADYKNPAYFTLQSSNVMVWHVAPDTSVRLIERRAPLKYKTTNDFLDAKSGTVYHLFNNHYPIEATAQDGAPPVPGVPGVQNIDASTLKSRIVPRTPSIANQVSDFKNYVYDCSNMQCISDGGGDLYDTGNQIKYKVNAGSYSNNLVYSQSYRADGVEMTSWSDGHPFFFLAWISNDHGRLSSFAIKVTSNMGADGGGAVGTYSDTFSVGPMRVTYKANHVYGAGDPSCAQTFFYITSTTMWGSRPPSTYSTPTWEASSTDNLNDEFVVQGSIRNTLVGYILLAKTTDTQISNQEISSALRTLAESLNTAQPQPGIAQVQECRTNAESMAVPVTMIAGSSRDISNKIPRGAQNQFTAGYLHFRPFSASGAPCAICPGIRSEGCQSSKMCIGGTNTMPFANGYDECGDFGNWPVENQNETILFFYGP